MNYQGTAQTWKVFYQLTSYMVEMSIDVQEQSIKWISMQTTSQK